MSANGAADLIFVNGAVYTVDAARSWAQAVAVREGRIVAVGTDDDVRELVGPRTEVVDLRRAHARCPASRTRTSTRSAAASTCCSATCTTSRRHEEYLRAIAEYAAANPDVPWILGWRLVDGRLPRRDADRRTRSTRSCRTGPCTCRTATDTARG